VRCSAGLHWVNTLRCICNKKRKSTFQECFLVLLCETHNQHDLWWWCCCNAAGSRGIPGRTCTQHRGTRFQNTASNNSTVMDGLPLPFFSWMLDSICRSELGLVFPNAMAVRHTSSTRSKHRLWKCGIGVCIVAPSSHVTLSELQMQVCEPG
jgi:hypothetical protein